MTSSNYPTIVKAALEISYDNGGINRYRSKEQMLGELEKFLSMQNPRVLKWAEKDLASLDEEELVTACTGEQPEREELHLLEITNELLDEIFNKVC